MAEMDWIRTAAFGVLLLPMAAGCNVFFNTDSVPFGGSSSNSDLAECASSCTCESDCGRSCQGDCTLTCESGATCEFVLSAGGQVTCEANSDCNVECAGGDCETICEGSCTMHCGPGAGACGWATCEGSRSTCGARGLACDAECP